MVQLRKSSYMWLFCVPFLPELLLRAGDYKALVSFFKGAAGLQRRKMSHEELSLYLDAFARPGVATAALNYYRCVTGNACDGLPRHFRCCICNDSRGGDPVRDHVVLWLCSARLSESAGPKSAGACAPVAPARTAQGPVAHRSPRQGAASLWHLACRRLLNP